MRGAPCPDEGLLILAAAARRDLVVGLAVLWLPTAAADDGRAYRLVVVQAGRRRLVRAPRRGRARRRPVAVRRRVMGGRCPALPAEHPVRPAGRGRSDGDCRRYAVGSERVDGNYAAYVPGPASGLRGPRPASRADVEAAIKEAIEMHLEGLAEDGEPTPERLPARSDGTSTTSAVTAAGTPTSTPGSSCTPPPCAATRRPPSGRTRSSSASPAACRELQRHRLAVARSASRPSPAPGRSPPCSARPPTSSSSRSRRSSGSSTGRP